MWALRYAYNKRVHRCGDYWWCITLIDTISYLI
jgi:hypothetical protein